MRKWIIPLLCLVMVLFITAIVLTKSTVTTVKYFPIDQEASFTEAATKFTILEESPLTLNWSAASASSESMYLRQDISLLFENGFFKGVQSKWQQDESSLHLTQSFMPKRPAYLQALTFHHGELHHPDDTITSIQKLTKSAGYILSQGDGFVFSGPTDGQDTSPKMKQLKEMTTAKLNKNARSLIEYFSIDPNEYERYSLIELVQYDETPLPNFSAAETEQILGQLWEGLYKNYIVRLKEKQNKQFQHEMPLILFAKDGSHLIVLFELSDGKQRLIQHLP